ncbi:hypothetical protein NLJ89_g5432 [Agrocybe chaxingu]|uniref:SWR1-complex protein 5 n=1 Tax=Agrocybe chaxingu TaxID=84603 RepID=A0A9W8K0T1_9AGAR|nr:hypothetical protein NLJ89_g5432 [Agrocybe chaxingu]
MNPCSKINNPYNGEDSDEEDEDYVPSNDRDDSDSEHSGDEAKQNSTAAPVNDPEEEKKRRDALWANFQASVATPAKSPDVPGQKKLVKVEKRFRFAGEEVVEVVEVPEDSADAKKWPLWKDPDTEATDSAAPELPTEDPILETETPTQPTPSPTPSSSAPTPSTSSSTLVAKPLAKRPGPRKPKTVLGPVPGPSKAKKLTTLDKSAMDWRSHLQEAGSSAQEELEANRRAGGYLEKVEFLKRVEERKEDQLEAAKRNKRRKL